MTHPNPDVLAFQDQNPFLARALSTEEIEEFAEHHSGVLGCYAGHEGRYVKMHETWGPGVPDEPGDIVVHEYSLDDESYDDVRYFTNAREAYADFLSRLTAPAPPRSYNVGVPANVEVHPDGSLVVTVDLADLDDLYETENEYSDEDVEADQRTVGAALAAYRTNGNGYAEAIIVIPAPGN